MYINIYIYIEREREMQKKNILQSGWFMSCFFLSNAVMGLNCCKQGWNEKIYPIVNIFFQMRDPQIEGVQY